MSPEQVIAGNLLLLGLVSTGIVIWTFILDHRIKRIENLPSVRDFLKQAKNKKKVKK